MKTIEQTYTVDASAADVWQALVDPGAITQWGGGPAKMSDKVGDAFSLWGGDIYGKNIEVIPGKLLVQEWSDDRLETPSTVRFELQDNAGKTTIHLVQSGIPEDRVEDLDAGWRDYYLGPLQELLEAGK